MLVDLLLLLTLVHFCPSLLTGVLQLGTSAVQAVQAQIAHPTSSPEEGSVLVAGKPSLSPAFLNAVLASAQSPAAGTGEQLYDLSTKARIDDAIALGFFKVESQYGTTGIARYTHSLGNIRCSSGYRCLSGYRAYSSYAAGYADWYQLIRALYVNTWHLTSVQQIVPKYDPASDGNDPAAYIQTVQANVRQWRAGEVQA